jgi:hypothetical protein
MLPLCFTLFYSILFLLFTPSVVDPPEVGKLLEYSEIFSNICSILYWLAGWQPSKAMVVCVGIFALSTNGFSRSCSNLGALQGKSALDLDAAVRTTSQKLIQARAAANGLHPY